MKNPLHCLVRLLLVLSMNAFAEPAKYNGTFRNESGTVTFSNYNDKTGTADVGVDVHFKKCNIKFSHQAFLKRNSMFGFDYDAGEAPCQLSLGFDFVSKPNRISFTTFKCDTKHATCEEIINLFFPKSE